MKDLRVLLVYVNSPMDNLIPLNISYLVSCLKGQGADVRLFDTTFYKTTGKTSDEARVEMLQVKPFDLAEYGIHYKSTDVYKDFIALVNEYKPHVIGFSVVESTYSFSIKLLQAIQQAKKDLGIKVIFGGVFAIFAYKKIIEHPLVDMVCHGEGENTIIAVCDAVLKKAPFKDIDNLAVKEDGQIFYNKKSPLVILDKLPYLDFSLFEKERFFKPMGGKVFKMAPVEFARGCPYTCTYCASPSFTRVFKESGRWFRLKSIKRIINEIRHYAAEYNIEYFYFISESFLSMPQNDFNEFIEFYKLIKIPFWFNTRAETITADKLDKLEAVNCNRISVGLESGSEYVREKLLKRYYTNDYFVEKFNLFNGRKIQVSVNNIIGFPDETREQIFETIKLNRKIKAESFGAYIFQPYYGAYLREYCLKKGYISEDYIAQDAHLGSGLKMPCITDDEIRGLQRTFALYVKLPENKYSDIMSAEKFDKHGNEKFKDLSELYYASG